MSSCPLSPPFSQDVAISHLKVATQYRVSVGAYGWAGEGRPSMPRDVSTASHGGLDHSSVLDHFQRLWVFLEMLAYSAKMLLFFWLFLNSVPFTARTSMLKAFTCDNVFTKFYFCPTTPLCIHRDVYASLSSDAASCCSGVRHRAGIVMATGRERGKRSGATLSRGLHQVQATQVSPSFHRQPQWHTKAASLRGQGLPMVYLGREKLTATCQKVCQESHAYCLWIFLRVV